MKKPPLQILAFLIFASATGTSIAEPNSARFPVRIDQDVPIKVEVVKSPDEVFSEQQKANSDQLHSAADLKAQVLSATSAERAAVASEKMVHIGWLQLALSILTLVFTWRAVIFAGRTLIAESRPVLFSETPKLVRIDAEKNEIHIGWKFRNVGRGPGLIVSYAIDTDVLTEGGAEEAKLEDRTGREIIAPVSVDAAWGPPGSDNSAFILPDSHIFAMEKGGEFFIRFVVRYRSPLYPKIYKTSACYRLLGSTGMFVPQNNSHFWSAS